MIDYIKILLKNIDVNRLLKLPFLEFKTEVSETTGEISTKRIAEYHFCKIMVYDSGITIFTGSIHKLWNSINKIKAPNYKKVKQYRGYNGNQFTAANIIEAKEHLQYLFECEPEQMKIQNIELGVNTTTGIKPDKYLIGLLYHKNKLFEYRYNSNLAQAHHQRFIFKIYNKSNQYGMSEFTLRIELKIIKIEEIKNIGLNTFADLNTETLHKAKNMLLDRFDEVMHYDYSIDKKKLSNNQKKYLIKYSNPRYWMYELKPNHRFRHKKRLLEITLNNSHNLHQKIRDDIEVKCSIINRLFGNPKCSISNRSSIGLNMLQSSIEKSNKKLTKKKHGFCSITGIDISMQRDDSSLLSHTGLHHLRINNKKLFEEIKRKYLTKKWLGSIFSIQIREIAHNIRDTKRNQKNKQKRLYPPHQEQLFNINI